LLSNYARLTSLHSMKDSVNEYNFGIEKFYGRISNVGYLSFILDIKWTKFIIKYLFDYSYCLH